jgi:hypothetical protein
MGTGIHNRHRHSLEQEEQESPGRHSRLKLPLMLLVDGIPGRCQPDHVTSHVKILLLLRPSQLQSPPFRDLVETHIPQSLSVPRGGWVGTGFCSTS